jgi:hypothetical protein
LEKDRKQRLQSIGDARRVLEESAASAAETVASPGGGSARFAAAAAPFAIIAAAALFMPWRATRPVAHPLVRLDVDLGSEVSLPAPDLATSSVVLSPDGTRLAYAAIAFGGQSKLFTRRLDQPKATELPGTDGADGPFFSPDGLWIGFATPGKIGKISVEGGAVVPLGEVATFAGAWWGEDGNIIVSDAFGKGLGADSFRRGILHGDREARRRRGCPGVPASVAGRQGGVVCGLPVCGPGESEH